MTVASAWIDPVRFTDEQRRILAAQGLDAEAIERLRVVCAARAASHRIDSQLATSGEVRERVDALRRTLFDLATQLADADPSTVRIAREAIEPALRMPAGVDLREALLLAWGELGEARRALPAQSRREAWIEAVADVAWVVEPLGVKAGRGKSFRAVCDVAFEAMRIPASAEHSIRAYLRSRGEKGA
jgi:hypothetical protein